MLKHAYIIFFFLVLVGCTHNLTLGDMEEYGNAAEHMGRNIAIGPEFMMQVDKAHNMGETVTCPTGEMAKQIFSCKDNCLWKIELLSSQLTVETRDEFPLPIFHTTANYNLTCLLTGQDSRVPLSASAKGKAGVSYEKAVSQAVTSALNNIAKQARMITTEK